jgi:hypothetical protein
MEIIQARTEVQINQARKLFRKYERWLDVGLFRTSRRSLRNRWADTRRAGLGCYWRLKVIRLPGASR